VITPPSKSIVCHDNKGGAMVSMSTINGGKIVGTGLLFKCRLFEVLGMFDVLFEVVLKTVLVCDTDIGVCFIKVFVWPDCNVFIV
jgi:hypothetical protein